MFLLAFLLMIPTVIATSTEINVKTLPDHNVFVSIMDTSQTQYLKVLDAKSDSKGKATVVFEDETTSFFKIALRVKKGDNAILALKKFDQGYNAGQTINIQYFPEGYLDPFAEECDSEHFDLCKDEGNCTNAIGHWYNNTCNAESSPEPETEPTPEELVEKTAEETTEETTADTPTTGLSISENAKSIFLSNKMYWYAGIGLFVAIVLLFVIRTVMRRRTPIPTGGTIKIKSAVTGKPGSEHFRTQSASNKLIEDAERKLKEAQAEINRLKNKEKIVAAKKRIQKEQEALKKLEEG